MSFYANGVVLDHIDRKILRELQLHGRLANNDLAHKVGLSASPCLRRVKQLEDQGVIRHYVALLDPVKVNLSLTVFARIWLKEQSAQTVGQFIEAVKILPEVLECQLMSGDCDFFLRIVTSDLEAYRKFQIQHLNKISAIQNIKTEIPLQNIKQSTVLPI